MLIIQEKEFGVFFHPHPSILSLCTQGVFCRHVIIDIEGGCHPRPFSLHPGGDPFALAGFGTSVCCISGVLISTSSAGVTTLGSPALCTTGGKNPLKPHSVWDAVCPSSRDEPQLRSGSVCRWVDALHPSDPPSSSQQLLLGSCDSPQCCWLGITVHQGFH